MVEACFHLQKYNQKTKERKEKTVIFLFLVSFMLILQKIDFNVTISTHNTQHP